MKDLILCADDYAQNIAISDGIIDLARALRINAISCMTTIATWHEAHFALKTIQERTYIGLHLNLTHGKALSRAWASRYGAQLPTLFQLLKSTHLHQLNIQVLAFEIQAQIDAFTQQMNALPDFIDGHQHIHQLPMVRDVLFTQNIPMRKTSRGWLDVLSFDGFPKRQLITLLGGICFEKRLTMPFNTSFSGIYQFKSADRYRQHFKTFLKHTVHDGLIMCHPGHPTKDTRDPLNASRHLELNYFMSDDYLADMQEYSFQLKHKEI